MAQANVIQGHQQLPGFGAHFGAGLGQGISQGISKHLENMYEEKDYQKKLARQQFEYGKFYKGHSKALEKLGLDKEDIRYAQENGIDPNITINLAKLLGENKKLEAKERSAAALSQYFNQTRGSQNNQGFNFNQNEPSVQQNPNPLNTLFNKNFQNQEQQFNPNGFQIAPQIAQQAAPMSIEEGQQPPIGSIPFPPGMDIKAMEDIARFEQGERNLKLKEREQARKDRSEIFERYKKTLEKTDEEAKTAKNLLPSMEVAVENLKDIETGAGTWNNIVQTFGGSNALPFMSKEGQILEQSKVPFFENFRESMGGVLTDAKIGILQDKLASVGKDAKANALAIYLPYLNNKLKVIEQKESEDLLKKNKGEVPSNYHDLLDKKMKPYREKVNKDLNDILNGKEPSSEMSKTEISKFGKTLDPSNTRHRQIMQGIFEEAKGDPEMALKIAEQKGYRFK
jgi:hypothetical protein|uniref:Uncharacterized protein n=1 Tax=uncultured Caudovirales phage TaxID=2100421 RepID=A0A6J5KYJ6_9CAUD|nr:hypothetical protein UFOVP88_34 [uncultured Caudovirales phage]